MRKLLLILLLVTLAVPARAADKPDPRPNILFCIADDWGWPNAGVYGDPVCKTPAFDGIAKDGRPIRSTISNISEWASGSLPTA